MKRLLQFALLLTSLPAFASQTWFVRADGAALYNATNTPLGHCDGLADLPDPGSGSLPRHCAVSHVAYLYLNGVSGVSGWNAVSGVAGGDTIVVRGCAPLPNETNSVMGQCRLGLANSTNTGSGNLCVGVSAPWGCDMPPLPNGTSGAHTILEGGPTYDGSATPIIGYPVGTINEPQLYAGWGSGPAIWLAAASYVDIKGFEITTHNQVNPAAHATYAPGTTYNLADSVNYSGTVYYSLAPSNLGHTPNISPTFWKAVTQCTLVGAPAYPSLCSTSLPVDDFGKWGIVFDNTTANIGLTDLYIHGFLNQGLSGAVGGAYTLTRVQSDFNAFAGWNFDDGTSFGVSAALTFHYFMGMGNGCLEQYPISNTQFPALSCWDSVSGGFGDCLSGQDTTLTSFIADHFECIYNTKDAFIGPHTQIQTLQITDSFWYGNMGQALKWGSTVGANFLFQGNLVVGNCYRMSETITGAAQNFAVDADLPGSYLSNFCRAGGDTFSLIQRHNSTFKFVGNTVISPAPEVVLSGCGYYSSGSFVQESDCGITGTWVWDWKNTIFIGWNDPQSGAGSGPTLWDFGSVYQIPYTSSYSFQYGIINGDPCSGTIHCISPLLTSQPAQAWPGSEAAFDVYLSNGFYPTLSSPVLGAGTAVGGWTTDYYGVALSTPPPIGAVMPLSAPSGTSVGGGVTVSGGVTFQ